MCGICGYIGPTKLSAEDLERMNNAMYHRGPDDGGIWQGTCYGGKSIGLAHRRLSILDLSELGHQPMISRDGRWIVAFNGEIYNFKSVREQLKERGYTFVSECDTEVVLYSYAEWEEHAVEKLDGMFAIAAYDSEKEILYLARDRIGKKPLYYYKSKNDLVFASELKAIMACPLYDKQMNKNALRQYLCKQYLMEEDTFFENTFKLKPGHQMIVKENGASDVPYWSILDEYKDAQELHKEDYASCKKELKSKVYSAVEKRLVADVPAGTFLSGGIDSTLVTAVANDLYGGIRTFTIGFDDKVRDETEYAAQTAKLLGTTHTAQYVSEQDMRNMISKLATTFDEPYADPSAIPSLLVAEIAKKDVTVALTGDGGDEFYCGYSMYDYLRYAEKLDGVAGIANAALSNPLGRRVKRKLPESAVALLENRDDAYKVQLFESLPEKVVDEILLDCSGLSAKSEIEKSINVKNFQTKRMLFDMCTYLPEDVLAKADRTSMQYSLELRCPLLDTDVMTYSFRIPHAYKYYGWGGDKKHILKDILYDFVPKEMMDRPKNGFGVPLGKWLRTFLLEEIQSLSTKEFLAEQGLFRYEGIQKLIAKVKISDTKPYPKVLWAYYIFQKWYIENMS